MTLEWRKMDRWALIVSETVNKLLRREKTFVKLDLVNFREFSIVLFD